MGLEGLEVGDGGFFRGGYVRLIEVGNQGEEGWTNRSVGVRAKFPWNDTYVLPASRSTTVLVFDQQMTRSDFILLPLLLLPLLLLPLLLLHPQILSPPLQTPRLVL